MQRHVLGAGRRGPRSARCCRPARRGRRVARGARSSSPCRAATRSGSRPSGVPSRASNSSRSIWPACGRNSKIPPPSLLTTTIRTGASAWPSEASAFMSWKRPRSPVTIQVGRPVARRGADPRGDQAVDPVRAAVGEEQHVGVAARQERLLVADRHARRGVDEVAVGVGAAERPLEAGLGRLGRARRAPPRSPPPQRLPASSQRSAQPGSAAARRVASASAVASAAGSARTIAPAMRVGSFQPWAGSTTSCAASGSVGEPLAQRLAGRHLAEAQDQVGRERARAARGRSARRRRSPATRSWGPKRSCEVGSARIGKPGGARQARRSAPRRRVAIRPATISPRRGSREPLGERVDQRRRRGDGAGGTVGQRPLAAALERQRRGRGDVAGPRLAARAGRARRR